MPPLWFLPPADQVNSDIAIWTSAFVLLTLMVNAPSVRCVSVQASLNPHPRA